MWTLTVVSIVWFIGILDDNFLRRLDTYFPVHTLPTTQIVHYVNFLLDTSIWEIICFRYHRRLVQIHWHALGEKPNTLCGLGTSSARPCHFGRIVDTSFPVHTLPKVWIMRCISVFHLIQHSPLPFIVGILRIQSGDSSLWPEICNVNVQPQPDPIMTNCWELNTLSNG